MSEKKWNTCRLGRIKRQRLSLYNKKSAILKREIKSASVWKEMNTADVIVCCVVVKK